MMSTRYPDRQRTTLTDVSITVDGVTYVLTDEACMTQAGDPAAAIFEAHAIRADERPDEDGYQPLYCIQWDILPEWDGADGGEACDWDTPDCIEYADDALME